MGKIFNSGLKEEDKKDGLLKRLKNLVEEPLSSEAKGLVHCNLVKNDYQHASKVLFTFVPNKQFGQLIDISSHSLTMMNTINTDFLLLIFGLQTKLVKHLKSKIMSF